MLSHTSLTRRWSANVACTSRSSLLMGVSAIVSGPRVSYGDLAVHEPREEEVAGLGKFLVLLVQLRKLLEHWRDCVVKKRREHARRDWNQISIEAAWLDPLTTGRADHASNSVFAKCVLARCEVNKEIADPTTAKNDELG